MKVGKYTLDPTPLYLLALLSGMKRVVAHDGKNKKRKRQVARLNWGFCMLAAGLVCLFFIVGLFGLAMNNATCTQQGVPQGIVIVIGDQGLFSACIQKRPKV